MPKDLLRQITASRLMFMRLATSASGSLPSSANCRLENLYFFSLFGWPTGGIPKRQRLASTEDGPTPNIRATAASDAVPISANWSLFHASRSGHVADRSSNRAVRVVFFFPDPIFQYKLSSRVNCYRPYRRTSAVAQDCNNTRRSGSNEQPSAISPVSKGYGTWKEPATFS